MLEALNQLLRGCFKRKTPGKTGCACCGRCCEAFGGHLHASARDLARWEHESRDDLLKHVNRLDWIWVDPETKKLLDPCPFIKQIADNKKICGIYETRPDICRDYPTLAHGHRCLSGGFLKM
ncbi:MAG: YkgJ family cysteine cluster protein [Desulfuromonadaceae bacterium]|nr:YkgJ family cysteine cluster protein [Desulfuromonadaceae bacterium]